MQKSRITISVIFFFLLGYVGKAQDTTQLKLSLSHFAAPGISMYELRNESLIREKNFSFFPFTMEKYYIPWEHQEHPITAIAELGLTEIIPWSFTKFIRHWDNPADNWADVGFRSWWNNLNYGWEYDGDNFLTNYFAHPYHGSVYFNAGRANGYDFLESAAWSFAGSTLWELFGEVYRPSINDWVNTSVNGIALGEITYRLATYITDNTATGSKRTWQEIAGALINPVRGLSRLMSGEVSRTFENPEWRVPNEFYVLLNTGFRQIDRHGDRGDQIISEGVQEGFLDVDVYYTNGFGRDLNVPFSSFTLSASIASGAPNLTLLSATGNLYGWRLKKNSLSTHILNISLDYLYFNHIRTIYGGTSIAPRFISSFQLKKNLNLNAILGLNIVLMGATPNDYFLADDGRNYDFGPGIGHYIGATLKNGVWDLVSFYYRGEWIWTRSEPSGSKHHLHTLWLDAQYPITTYLAIGIGGGVYLRESFYDAFDDVKNRMPIARIFIKTALF